MNLDESQSKQVAAWLEAGLKVSEIQQRLTAEFGLKLTYMEVRFLLDDLKLKPKDQPTPMAPATVTPPASAAPDSEEPEEDWEEAGEAEPEFPTANPPPLGTAKVTVTVDQMVRPGAMLSGKVTFTDGQKAEWYLDQMGRLGVAAEKRGYKPTPTDLQTFQAELQTELAKLGY